MATFLLRMDDDQKARWAAAAKRDSRSLNSWIVLQVEAGIPVRDLLATPAAIEPPASKPPERATVAVEFTRRPFGGSIPKAKTAGRKEKER